MAEGATTLSEILQRVGDILKTGFSSPGWIMAEILEINVNRSGHCYLELVEKNEKDDRIIARARATIWASRYSMLRPYFEATAGTGLKSGIKLLFRASVEFHALYGFSLNITDVDPAYTMGDLARQKQEVIRKLTKEGVIDMNRELPFPMVPQHIAVISSETAAGYGDFMESILFNHQGFRIDTTLFPAVMQGEEASPSIIAALDRIFIRINEFQCVAIIRGGGSRADLECFNSYDLAYYITQFPLPVVTGIGHERDQSVADIVAARALKTPTAVAEYFIDLLLAFEFRLAGLNEKMEYLADKIVREKTSLLERLSSELDYKARRFLDRKTEFLARIGYHLPREIKPQLVRKAEHLSRLAGLLPREVGTQLEKRSEYLSRISFHLPREVRNLLTRRNDLLLHLEKRAELVAPENILKRGYSITLLNGKALTGTEELDEGTMIDTRLYKGRIRSTVEKIITGNDKRQDQL
jgi:exodeoxyribonuclease VII large subunit